MTNPIQEDTKSRPDPPSAKRRLRRRSEFPGMPSDCLSQLDKQFFGTEGPEADVVFSPWSLLHSLLIL
ncbi:hypothetical protein KIPB_015659, partial [Kipferlia bialata]|eukprot:g15659.t1